MGYLSASLHLLKGCSLASSAIHHRPHKTAGGGDGGGFRRL